MPYFGKNETRGDHPVAGTLLGTEVSRLFSGPLAQGPHSFTWDAGGMAPGMYECLVRMNGTVEQTSLVLMR